MRRKRMNCQMAMRTLSSFAAIAIYALPAAGEPLFPNSVTSNDLDFILEDDLTAGFCLVYEGTQSAEMPDKRNDILFADNVHVFGAQFAEGDKIGFWVHPDVGDRAAAEALILPVARAVGRLPLQMRLLLNHVVIHKGDETAFAEDAGRFFVMYSQNIDARISTHDLSETVFHESVHATMDIPLAESPEWIAAQGADNAFLTDYAARLPMGEDMAESALFAWAVLKHPGRLPAEIEAQVAQMIPNRLAYFENLFADWRPPSPQDQGPPC